METCLNHVLGWSNLQELESIIQDQEHKFCFNCIPDEKNKECPYYSRIELYVIDVKK